MSTWTDPRTGKELRGGASNADDAHLYGLTPGQVKSIADAVLADQARPEGIGAPSGERTDGRAWAGLDRHSDPGHWARLGGGS